MIVRGRLRHRHYHPVRGPAIVIAGVFLAPTVFHQITGAGACGPGGVQQATYVQQVAQGGVPRIAQTAGTTARSLAQGGPTPAQVSSTVTSGMEYAGGEFGKAVATFRASFEGRAIPSPAPPPPSSTVQAGYNTAGCAATAQTTPRPPTGGSPSQQPAAWGGWSNGRIPETALRAPATAPTHRLHPEAAVAWDQLSNAYATEFGTLIVVTDSYRNLAGQIDVKARKPGLAAAPGTSTHGWGKAVDLGGGIEKVGTPQDVWMRENASRFGWILPDWAQPNGSKPENWHYEYRATDSAATA